MDTVLNRWVVLKGLLNSKDAHLVRVAVQEREFLAAVKHRNIVGIYDFVTQGSEGFIVMEYVNGKSLLQLRQEHGGPLPAARCRARTSSSSCRRSPIWTRWGSSTATSRSRTRSSRGRRSS